MERQYLSYFGACRLEQYEADSSDWLTVTCHRPRHIVAGYLKTTRWDHSVATTNCHLGPLLVQMPPASHNTASTYQLLNSFPAGK